MGLDVHGAAFGRARFCKRLTLRIATSVVSVLVPLLAAHAQVTPGANSPEDEYKKYIKVSEDIEPLGDTPFGERISLYDGSLSFEQTDISVPGRGPTIVIGRIFKGPVAEERRDLEKRAFGDWDLDIPLISTIAPINQQGTHLGWRVNSTDKKTICSNFREPPSVPGVAGDPSRADWEPGSWWSGVHMRIPGKGTQDLLSRASENGGTPYDASAPDRVYPIVTKQNWILGCTTELADPSLEAFIAYSPDGTQYWFNRLSYRYMTGVTRSTNSGPDFAARSGGTVSPMAALDDFVNREEGRMLVTRIVDRFGNGIAYSYDAQNRLTSIDSESAEDGRHVTLAYNGDQISSITVVGGTAGNRTWNYSYQPDGLGPRLSAITQPDGSQWTFDISALNSAYPRIEQAGTCNAIGVPSNLNDPPPMGHMTHPSGLSAVFVVQPIKRGRSYVGRACKGAPGSPAIPNGPGTSAEVPNAWYSMAIVQKQFTGAGIGTQTWNYTYSPANESWSVNCAAGCPTTVWTNVSYPDGHSERSTFSNKFDFSESLLQSEEVFEGAADASRRRKLTTYHYVEPTSTKAANYPRPWGYMPGSRVNSTQNENQIPMDSQSITIDDDENPLDPRPDDVFEWTADSFDRFARPTATLRKASFQGGISETRTYKDDLSRWLLSLPEVSNAVVRGNTVELSRNVYDPVTTTLSERYRFGRKVMSYTFDGFGQLTSFTDGNAHTTTLADYKRGIPRTITYPDTRTQSIAVDDLSQIASITNQAGATTSYAYDGIGRLSRIDYPAGDTVAWAPRIFQYGFGGSARGVNGNHWVRTITQGDKLQRTDFDAMLRPILSGTARASDLELYVSARTDYDWKGRKILASYPRDGALDHGDLANGIRTAYDVLGRATSSSQDAEFIDPLVSSTTYLSGGAKRTVDPKGIATTTWYQAFDQPAYENVVKVAAPEGVLQTISRDELGNPWEIAQGGGGAQQVKTMTYDSEFRLCRTHEAESGSEITAYDGADNIAWSAAGSSFDTAGQCGQEQVAEIAKTVRAYDAMNRVTSIVYPTGTEPSSFTYDPIGNPATATSGMVSWTFGRNKLGLLTAEVLALDGWSWPMGYGYDANGALSTVLYPDGEIVHYNPDALGRPTGVESYVSAVAYFPDGDVKSYNLGNGTSYEAGKNGRNLLSSFAFKKNQVDVVGEGLTYDANGNVTQIDDTTGSQRDKSMTYDNLNRLLSAEAPALWGTESYTYDTLNNIRSLTNSSGIHTYNYNGANQLDFVSIGATHIHDFVYDARGNTTSKNNQSLVFDVANRLTAIPALGATYRYDAAGRRVQKVTPAAKTYYAYNSAGQLMFEYDDATTNGTNYVYLGKKLIASKKSPNSVVIGNVDGVVAGASAAIQGWTCSTGLTTSLDVHLYVGGPAGTGTSLGSFRANQPSEAAIQTPCHTSGTAYRFSIPLSEANRVQFAGQALYVHGISPVGGANTLLPGSGTFLMPASILAPNPPASASAVASGDLATITVTWSSTPNTTSYTLEQQFNGSATWTAVYTGTATTRAIGNPPDGTYVFRVKACNANGCSNPTSSNAATIAHVPPAPSGVSVPGSSTGSVGVSWPASAYATVYRLEHANGGAWDEVYAGPATSATINEGASGYWYYRVRACNANGCSGYTTSGAVYVLLPPTVPPSLNGGGTSNNGAYGLNWSATPGATTYNLLENVNGAGWTAIQNSSAQSWSTSGRGNGTYYYLVQGCNASGCTGWSNQVAVTVSNIPPVPGQPRTSVRLSGSQRVVKVEWDALPYATSYDLMENSSIVWTGPQLVYSSIQPQGVSVTYRLRACSPAGCSAWGAPKSVIP